MIMIDCACSVTIFKIIHTKTSRFVSYLYFSIQIRYSSNEINVPTIHCSLYQVTVHTIVTETCHHIF